MTVLMPLTDRIGCDQYSRRVFIKRHIGATTSGIVTDIKRQAIVIDQIVTNIHLTCFSSKTKLGHHQRKYY